MALKKTLKDIVEVMLEEADNNPEFAKRLEMALGAGGRPRITKQKNSGQVMRRGNRRTPAVFDPVALAQYGDGVLRARLGALDIEQLKDIIAEYGMDTTKLAMKWKSSERLVSHIVQISINRAKKGEAFL